MIKFTCYAGHLLYIQEGADHMCRHPFMQPAQFFDDQRRHIATIHRARTWARK